MNIYSSSFTSLCPVNHAKISYTWQLSTAQVITVEDINAALRSVPICGLHEDIADELHKRFGGSQVITAIHHGVRIVTVRGLL